MISIRLFSSTVFLALCLLLSCLSRLQAQEDCKNALELASEYFDNGNYNMTINRLTAACHPEKLELESKQRIRAYELLIVAHVKKGSPDDTTKKEIRSLLNLFKTGYFRWDDDYKPSDFFEQAKAGPARKSPLQLLQEVEGQRGKRIRYFIIAAGITGLTAAFFLTRGGEEQLPGPPGPPPREDN